MLKPPVAFYDDIIPLFPNHEARTQLHGSFSPPMDFFSQKSHSGQYQTKGNTSNSYAQNRGPNPNGKIFGKITALKYSNHFSRAYQAGDIPQAFAAIEINALEWLLNTGATIHMTNNPSKLYKVQPYHGSD
ncbi:hypothetical protein ACH5RR_040721 [Cinchona calisaya]|uniref:Uncharacterized protein n=1 Tax=Cinchona calisaya TaxID=153742 RepID=A0ABD2XXL5_9GENT